MVIWRRKGEYYFGMDDKNQTEPPPHYTWPWFVLGMVLLGFVLAGIWMSVLVHRISQQRDFNMWSTPASRAPKTNSAPAKTNSASPGAQADPGTAERMAQFRDTLSGGNAEAGRKVFFDSPAANCGKCHKAGGQGGDNGPVLDGVGARESREFILQSILFPNAVINSNYQTVAVVLDNNTGISGTLKSETESSLVLVTPEDGPVTVQKSKIRQRWLGASPMPEGIWQYLTKQELRDLIEFVATLKAP